MTNIDDVRDKLNSTIDEQADTIARLELELAEARQENSQMARMLAEPSEVKADAEALRALAAWSAKDGGRTAEFMREPLGGWSCDLVADGYGPASGTGATLASAIMDALGMAGK